MSKTEQAAKSPSNSSRKAVAAPDGYRRGGGDVIGFHDPEKQGPIHGIPRGAKLSDSSIEKDKPSGFVIFELLDPCTVSVEDADGNTTDLEAKKGDTVGVWLKGGMRALKNMAGIAVFMQFMGEKKLKGRPAAQKPMKLYQFDLGPGKGGELQVVEDNRKQSRHKSTMFSAGRQPGEDIDEETGF